MRLLRKLSIWITAIALNSSILGGFPAAAPLSIRSGNLELTYESKDGVHLKYRGLEVIGKSALFLLRPGWSGVLFSSTDFSTALSPHR
jgi:hypothetical protein